MSPPLEDSTPQPRWRLAIGGIPDAVTAVIFWLCWQHPEVLGVHWLRPMVITILIEFLVVHSGGAFAGAGMIETRADSILVHCVLAVVYAVFVWAFAVSLQARWLYFVFAWLLLSKFLINWSASSSARRGRREQLIDWPFSVTAYLLALAFGFGLLVDYRGGVTDAVLAASGLAGAGMFEDHPWLALGAGTFYFGAMALWRMRLWRWRQVPRTRRTW